MAFPREIARPTTLMELRPLLQRGALPLAGGALTFNRLQAQAELVADVSGIEALRRVIDHDSGLTLGGAVMLGALLEMPAVPTALRQTLTRVVSPHVLNHTSIAESLTGRSHPLMREWLTALAALDAGVEVYHAAHDARTCVSIDALLAGEADTGAIIGLFLPRLQAGQALAAAQVSRTPADVPIVNVAVLVTLEPDGRVQQASAALGGVSPALVLNVALHGLSGSPLSEAAISAAAEEAASAFAPPDDYLGSSAYRREMGRVLTARVLQDSQRQLAQG